MKRNEMKRTGRAASGCSALAGCVKQTLLRCSTCWQRDKASGVLGLGLSQSLASLHTPLGFLSESAGGGAFLKPVQIPIEVKKDVSARDYDL